VRQVPASLQFENPPPARITLAFERAGGVSKYRTLEITRANIGRLASLAPALGSPDPSVCAPVCWSCCLP
jgi:hypothetical protein